LLKISISKYANLEVDLPKKLPAILGNPVQIRQVVMNLITNASEAIGDKEGAIYVRVSQAESSPDLLVGDHLELAAGSCLRLEVTDTGCGMPAEIIHQIFDPFFTTKFAGRGLGLAAVQGIVRKHGGAINVSSTPGLGTRFEILLPSMDNSVSAPANTAESASAAEPARVPATVLVVEDEEMLRVAVSKLLRNDGFSVIEAADGITGLRLFRANEDTIDVVLLDISLPGLSGREVLNELRLARPDAKVILTSAFSQESIRSSFQEQPWWGYIRKPYNIGELTNLLRRACMDKS
jgi:two-component system, cell cycle sensor histidine kinase and response regulator CckA